MNEMLSMLAATAIFASLVAGSATAHDSFTSSKMDGDSMMRPGLMDNHSEDQWNRLDRSFRDMSRLMERIHQGDDLEDQNRLMHEHMHQLQNGMMIMDEGWRMETPDNSRSPDDWSERMRNMERQMFLMQKMLSQMIEHEAAQYDREAE